MWMATLSMYGVFLFIPYFSMLCCCCCCFFYRCCSSVDAHKFVIRNLSSSETLNRVKDNILKISGWTIYNCGDFTKKKNGTAAMRIATNITRDHMWITVTGSSTAKENSKYNRNIKGDEHILKYEIWLWI